MKDIVQIKMDEPDSNMVNESTTPVVATLRYGDVILEIHMVLINMCCTFLLRSFKNMLVDYTKVSHVYIVCGKTDLRRGIDGLDGIIQNQYQLDVYEDALSLFCGRRAD